MLILYSDFFLDDSIGIFMRYPCMKIMSVFHIILKFSINPYFCRFNRIILSRLKKKKKIKKNTYGKIKNIFFGVGFGYPSDVVTVRSRS